MLCGFSVCRPSLRSPNPLSLSSGSARSSSNASAPKTPADVLSARVSTLTRPQTVLTLAPDASVGSVLQALAERRVLSAPVRVGEAPAAATPEFTAAVAAARVANRAMVCFCDMRDLLMSFLDRLTEADYGPASKLISRVKNLETAGAALADTPLASLPVCGTDGAFVTAEEAATMTLGQLLTDVMLVAPSTCVRDGGAPRARAAAHRVAVLATDAGVACVISQMDVARHLLTHVAALGPLARCTAADLGWAAGRVVTVTADAPAVRALASMRDAGVAGVAVVDATNGAMVGTFAFPDLRALVSDHLGALGLPVAEFLARSRGREFWGVPASASGGATPVEGTTPVGTPAGGGPGGPIAAAAAAAAARRASIGGRVGQEVVTATSDEPYSALLARLVARRVHRLHVVDSDARPVGVVTLTDALAAAVAAAGEGA